MTRLTKNKNPFKMELFESIATFDSSDQHGGTTSKLYDFIFHTGGSVWAMGWCPSYGNIQDNPTQSKGKSSVTEVPSGPNAYYLALGCHAYKDPIHIMGKCVQGKNCIQIWEIPNLHNFKDGDKIVPPCLVMGIGHNGGTTWDISWCPDALSSRSPSNAQLNDELLPRLGLLAAVLGDGSVQIWSVPQPRSLKNAYLHQPSHADNQKSSRPYLVKPFPVASITSGILDGSVPSTVDWLPSPPHDLLLIGCWDGAVAIVQLLPDTQNATRELYESRDSYGVRLISYFLSDGLSLRAAKWLPPFPDANTVDAAGRHIFLTAGHEGCIKIWDSRNQFVPLLSVPCGAYYFYDAIWTSNTISAVASQEDGTLRSVMMDGPQLKRHKSVKVASSVMSRGSNRSPIWSLSCHPSGRAFAYVGEDGVVGCADAGVHITSRRRERHVPLGAFRWVNNVLLIVEKEEIADNGGLYDGPGDNVSVMNPLQPLPQMLHRVAWSPLSSMDDLHGPGWLAYGGLAGIVRCQWTSLADALD